MKEKIIRLIKEELEKREDILFAYIFGSFVSCENFRDIDIAIYLSSFEKDKVLGIEFQLEKTLEDKIHIPFDVRIINEVPLGFAYNVIKDKIVVVDRDSSFRADFESLIFRKYFDYQFLIKEYLKEVKNAQI